MRIDKFIGCAAVMAAAAGMAQGMAFGDTPATGPSATAPSTTQTSARGPVDPKKLMTMEELQQAFADKQYQVVLAQTVRLVGQTNLPAGYVKYDLLELRGEAFLRVKNQNGAGDTFAAAAGATTDAKLKTRAAATAMLIRKSPNLQYTPRHVAGAPAPTPGAPVAKPAPIAVVEAEDRKVALAAYYDDEAFDVDKKVDAAAAAASLPPIVAAVKSVEDLMPLEFAVSGANAGTEARRDKLAARGAKLISDAISSDSSAVTAIQQKANQMMAVPVSVDRSGRTTAPTMYQKIGLTAQDKQDLQNIQGDCKKFSGAATEMGNRLQRMKSFQEVVTASDQLLKLAAEVANAEYGSGIAPAGSVKVQGH